MHRTEAAPWLADHTMFMHAHQYAWHNVLRGKKVPAEQLVSVHRWWGPARGARLDLEEYCTPGLMTHPARLISPSDL